MAESGQLALHTVLDCGRENLNEGDFLKLSNFLMTMHKPTEKPEKEVMHIMNYKLQIEVGYKTLKGEQMTILLTNYKKTIYRGATPNDTELKGTINGVEFSMERYVFLKNMHKRLSLSGCREIKRKIDDLEDEFPNLSKFYKHRAEVDRDECEDSDDDEESEEMHDHRNWNNSYKMTQLFALRDIDNY
jgi:hypothetical protein